MIKLFRDWTRKANKDEFDAVHEKLNQLLLREEKEPSIQLLRHELGSIDLRDLDEDGLTETERQEYASAISGVFHHLERDIKKMLYEQLLFISNESNDWNQVLFGRGTFNGLDLLLEKWRTAKTEHEARIRASQEKFDKHETIGQIQS